MFIDSHAHIDYSDYSPDEIEAVVQRARDVGVENILHIGSGEGIQSMERVSALLERFPDVYAGIGVHPHDAKLVNDEVMKRAEEIAAHPKVVAIGEIGLDFHYNHSTREEQIDTFRKFIQLAIKLKKPILIHDRDAHEEILQILKEENAKEVGGVFHCFSADYEFGRKVLEENFLVSFTGIVTFKNAQVMQDAAKRLPLEKMLIETDSPFLTPIPFRGKRNEPAYVRYVAEKIAELKGLDVEDVGRVTSLNARRLFKFGEQRPEVSIAYKIRDSLYLNITNKCTIACVFCPKFSTFEVKGYYLKLPKEPTFEEIVSAMGDLSGMEEVVFCGFGEPTQRLDLLKQLATYIHSKNLKVRLDTDGLGNLVHQKNILPELKGLIDAVNVSLNAPNAEVYAKVCPSKYKEAAYPEVKKFILEAKKYIPWVQASVVGMPEVDVEASRKVAEEELGVQFRHREYNNVG